LGRTRETHPLSHGVDEFFGFTRGGTGYLVEPGHGDVWIQNQVEGSRVGFEPMELGFFDHESAHFECAPNPFDAKVLPMSPE